jgi:hypothetical protein
VEQTLVNYTSAANGYEDKVGYCVSWVKDSITPQLHSYMEFGGKGEKLFDCARTHEGRSGSSSCAGMPHFWCVFPTSFPLTPSLSWVDCHAF